MIPAGRLKRLWLWSGDRYWTVLGHEITLPTELWRIHCWLRGHEPEWDQCMKPEHQYCLVCAKPMPYALTPKNA